MNTENFPTTKLGNESRKSTKDVQNSQKNQHNDRNMVLLTFSNLS